jgi:excisionase family DNA binding protein
MTAAEKAKKYMTLVQASEHTQIPVKTLRKKISLGLLPAYKPGKCILIDPKELEIFIRKARKKLAS